MNRRKRSHSRRAGIVFAALLLTFAGLSAIPQHLYDAAEVDGARTAWSRFWTVTWPMLGPTVLFVVTITAIRSFRVFESVATLTDGGNPVNR